MRLILQHLLLSGLAACADISSPQADSTERSSSNSEVIVIDEETEAELSASEQDYALWVGNSIGACVIRSGSLNKCFISFEQTCSRNPGKFEFLAGSRCGTVNDRIGACYGPTSTCLRTFESVCKQTGGKFAANKKCEEEFGACFTKGANSEVFCSTTTQSNCKGDFRPKSTCPVIEVNGSCTDPRTGGCEATTQQKCLQPKIFTRNGTCPKPNPEEMGSCFETNANGVTKCFEANSSKCPSPPLRFVANVNCPKVDPFGSCKLPNGECFRTTKLRCNGEFEENGICSVERNGACTQSNGKCFFTSETRCKAVQGTFAANQECPIDPPPVDRNGACTQPDGKCFFTSETRCKAVQGKFSPNQECPTVPPLTVDGACFLRDKSCTVTIESRCKAAGGDFVAGKTCPAR